MLNILVTGSNGQLGNEMRVLGAASADRYIYTDVAELDITDAEAVRAFVERENIDVIINCAAYTDVERAEDNEATAYTLNCDAVRNLAAAAAAVDGVLIHVSTDYVFSGDGHTPYTEEDATAPLGAYGRTKRAGEEVIEKSGCKYLIFRTAWLYSEYGRNFVKTMIKLTAERETLSVVFDQIGTPTYAADLAKAIFDIVEGRKYEGHNGIYHFTDEGVCSWYDFACEIAAETGNTECIITPCRTWEYPTKAVRPAYSLLDKSKYKRTFGATIPHWRNSLKRCITKIKLTEKI